VVTVRLILVRHYKTAFNVSGHIIGWGDSEPVAESAEDLDFIAATLAAHAWQPDRVVSSALGRAQRSAKHFADRFGLEVALATPALNEINYGALQARPKQWVLEHYPQYKTDPDFVFPEGESFHQMQRRCSDFLQTLPGSGESANILCVAHAGVIRAAVSHFLGLDLAEQLRHRISHRYIGVLDFSADGSVAYDEWGTPSGFIDRDCLPGTP